MTVKTTDLCDLFGDRIQIAKPVLRHFGGIDHFHGQAECVKVFETNGLVREILECDGKGRVLVVDGGGSSRCALVGGQLVHLAMRNRWAGMIVFGHIRNTTEIAGLPVGLMALAAVPVMSGKTGGGQRGGVVQFAGITIRHGCYVYADPDGLVAAEADLVHLPDIGVGKE
ncbi:MAG: ribonuclease E activity regulator RraA [Desulfobacterales bacterium]|jgi:regulator of ribonuclease activity A